MGTLKTFEPKPRSKWRTSFLRAVGSLSLAAAISIGGCSRKIETPKADQSEGWQEHADDMSQLGLQTSISQSGSQIGLTVRNVGAQPACIDGASWPTDEFGMNHFAVIDGGRLVPYDGLLNTVLGGETLVLLPGETWSLHQDLSTSYRANWASAEVRAFWAPFHTC